MRLFVPKHLCWRPDIPDFRDLLPESPEILKLLPSARLPDGTLPVSDAIQGGAAALLVGFDDKQISASRGLSLASAAGSVCIEFRRLSVRSSLHRIPNVRQIQSRKDSVCEDTQFG